MLENITKIKNSMGTFHNRIDKAEERFCKLEFEKKIFRDKD